MNYSHERAFGWMQVLGDQVVIQSSRLGPLGRLKAPGTWGSAAGLIWYTVAFPGLPLPLALLLVGVTLWLAVGLCGEAEKRLRSRDPSEVVLDEAVCMPLCLLGLEGWLIALRQEGWAWALFLGAFALFRFFDILKPLGISRLQTLPGGLGVVADDAAAALATNLTLQLLLALWFA
ncbi:MAG: phosphatidylglycerophosphatase A [Opitutales bacterium]